MEKPKKVAILIRSSNVHSKEMSLGIAKYANLYGHWELVAPPSFLFAKSPTLEKNEMWLKKNHVNGLIDSGGWGEKEEMSLGIPVIVDWDRYKERPNCGYFKTDNQRIGILAAEYLLSKGFKNFAFCGLEKRQWANERGDSFKQRIHEAGFEPSLYIQPKTQKNRRWENEQPFIIEWLKSLPKPTGILACHDIRGLYLIEACKAANIHVPEELAILGVDNDEMTCATAYPPLSSVALNAKKAGYEAAKLLDKLMSDVEVEENNVLIRPTHVVTRQSTDVLAIDDPDIAKAVRFIRTNTKRQIQVSDVAGAVPVLRRTLERRFKTLFGFSVNEEIARTKIENIATILVETNEPISKISYDFGFSDASHMTRTFRRVKGMTPLAYRNNYGSK